MKIKPKSSKKPSQRSRSRSSSLENNDPLEDSKKNTIEYHEFLKEIYLKFKRLSFKIIIANQAAIRLYRDYIEIGKSAIENFAMETLIDFPIIKEAFINDLKANNKSANKNKEIEGDTYDQEGTVVKTEENNEELEVKENEHDNEAQDEVGELNVELTDHEFEVEIQKKQKDEIGHEKKEKLPLEINMEVDINIPHHTIKEEVPQTRNKEISEKPTVRKEESKPVENISKSSLIASLTNNELRSELIQIFKKYDAYDEDPASHFYDNIMSILREKGPHGLRDCMKSFKREKREKILKDISGSGLLRSLWKALPQKSPIKDLLNKEFKKCLKDHDIDKYGESFEKNGLKGIESIKKILNEKEWNRLLKLLKDERLVKSEQYRSFLEDKIIYFIDQKKISKKLGKSKGSLSKELSKEIMEKGLDIAVEELEGRFFRKKLKVK